MNTRACLAAPLVLSVALGLAGVARADAVTQWNETLRQVVRADRSAPPYASRAMAMTHLAIEAAVATIEGREPIADVNRGEPADASIDAAIAAASHRVLVELFPAQRAACDAALDVALASIPEGKPKRHGITHGERIGEAILRLRADDGADLIVAYVPGDLPGNWQPTPPAFAPSLLPQWSQVRPFALLSGSQFRQGGPPPLGSEAYAAAFNETASLGAKNGSTRTADQTENALFWADGAGTETPPGHWNRIAAELSVSRGLTVAETATLFALINVAMADAAIASWDMKYTYNLWRPVTASARADEDGNLDTSADPAWESFLVTPPFPEYVSGHSTFSGAGSTILARFFGNDAIPFSTGCDALPGVTRSFVSFSAAAEEAGRSRIYGGIHWQFSNADGMQTGREIGDWVWGLASGGGIGGTGLRQSRGRRARE